LAFHTFRADERSSTIGISRFRGVDMRVMEGDLALACLTDVLRGAGLSIAMMEGERNRLG